MFANLLLLAPAAFGLTAPMGAPMRATASCGRARPAVAGLFDSLGAGEKPVVTSDKVTPFDRWLGLDKGAPEAVSEVPGAESARYVDPSDAANYVTVMLAKPMGIAFRENEGTPHAQLPPDQSRGSRTWLVAVRGGASPSLPSKLTAVALSGARIPRVLVLLLLQASAVACTWTTSSTLARPLAPFPPWSAATSS